MDFLKKFKKNSKLLFLLLLGLALLLLILFIVFVGFSWWFWILLILWLLFFAGYFKFFIKFTLTFSAWMIIYVIIFILTLSLLISSGNGGKSGKTSSGSGSAKKLSAEECKSVIEKYNNKVLKISGEGLIGTVGITIDAENCRINGQYIATFNGSLAQNPGDFFGSSLYYYMIRMHKPGDNSRGDNDYGALSPVLQNAGKLPDPFANSQTIAQFYRPLGAPDAATNDFYWHYTIDTYFSEARYQQILSDVVLEIVDTKPYITVTDEGNGMKTYSADHDRAEKEGTIVKTINLTVSE